MEPADKNLGRGFINVIMSATAMASLPILGKIAYAAGLGPVNTLILRYLSAFVLLSLVLIIGRKFKIVDLTPLIILQGIFLFTASIFYFHTIKYLSAGLTNVVFFTHPINVAALAIIIYREKMYLRLGLGLLMALGGIFLVSGIGTGENALHLKGLLLGSAASICYALYYMVGQKAAGQTDSLKLTNSLSFICVVLLSVVFHDQVSSITQLEPKQIFIGCMIGLLATVLAVTFLMRGIIHIGASKASLISASEPALTLIIAFLVLGEVLTIREMAGSLFIFVSIVFAVYPRP